MNLRDVLGILVFEDGVEHSFGRRKANLNKDLNDDNYHNIAFLNEIYPSDWFKNTGYDYDLSHNIFYNSEDMCRYGFCILINSCSKQVNGDYNLYSIQVPENMSDNLKNYLISKYDDLKNIIEEDEALFYGYIYDDEGKQLDDGLLFNIDEFYDRLNLLDRKKSR